MNKVEQWKSEKHGFDVWPDVLRHAEEKTPMKQIDNADLERMKWHGFFYRKRDTPGTYMNRIRLTACELSADQAKEIAYLAYEYGHGIVDVTTRGNIQIQGLSIDHLPKTAERLNAVGLSSKQSGHDNIRNVFCHPLSGADPDELIDTRQLCHNIAALFLDSRTYSDLPRKFNIAVNGRRQHGLTYWTQDLSFLAHRTEDGQVLFQVLIAGTQGQNPHLAWHLPVLVTPPQVVPLTKALLDIFRAQGSREKRDRARLRYLIERIGVGGVLEYLEQNLSFPMRPCVSEPSPPAGYDELVGWFRQKQPDRWAMGLCVPLGRLSWQQLEGLAVLAKKWGDSTLRTTHEQGLIVLNIPGGFKDAAATDAARHGLSVHADTLALNTVACTGKQFCNIAVTEAKGQMFQLIERLRQQALTLHGIRIHMSGCPSSCAQHFTADIGLKGVRVRRLLGTREGFDVYLGGGVSGQIHLGLTYRLGVDADQLPQLIEEVTSEYYLKHKPGQTFSAYWRETLHNREAAKVGDEEYTPPRWLCEGCGYEHRGEDPPVFCPSCAGLRRLFARLEDDAESVEEPSNQTPARSDGFVFVAKKGDLSEGQGLTVEVGGDDYALFLIDGQVHATESACPHEGAPLAEGTVDQGVVTCPWHGWTFNACTGCSISPAGNDVKSYETLVEDGNIYIKTGEPRSATTQPDMAEPHLPTPSAKLPVRQVLPGQRKTVAVIGNGPVGLRFCQQLLRHDETKQYNIVTFCEEPRPAYDRISLTQFFTHRDADQLLFSPLDWYEQNGITLHVGDRATTIDRANRIIRSAKGVEIKYDVAVLATGSYPFVPAVDGIDKKGVFVYRTIEHLQEIIAYAEQCKSAAVIGGGLLGLEAAKAAYDLGQETHVVEFMPRLMPRQIDGTGSKLLVKRIEQLGVRVHLNKSTEAVLGNGKVEGVSFGEKELPVDMIIVSAGIRPRDELARDCGLKIGERGGVVVNDHLQTSDANIYAVGEVALHEGVTYGLVAPGYQMADVLAARLCGDDREFSGADLSTKLKLLGVDVASFGDYEAGSDRAQALTYESPDGEVYKKLLFNPEGTRLLGGVLVGDATDYARLLTLVRRGKSLSVSPHELLTGENGRGAASTRAAPPIPVVARS